MRAIKREREKSVVNMAVQRCGSVLRQEGDKYLDGYEVGEKWMCQKTMILCISCFKPRTTTKHKAFITGIKSMDYLIDMLLTRVTGSLT